MTLAPLEWILNYIVMPIVWYLFRPIFYVAAAILKHTYKLFILFAGAVVFYYLANKFGLVEFARSLLQQG